MAAGLTVSTCRRTNDAQYTSAAAVQGLSDIGTLTRDYDIFDPATPVEALLWSASNAAKSVRTPTAGETGTIYTVLFDGTYYVYQEFTYDAALTVTEVTANKLGHASGKTLSIANVSGTLKATPSASITGSAKHRASVVKG
jgi:hypothetical protein